VGHLGYHVLGLFAQVVDEFVGGGGHVGKRCVGHREDGHDVLDVHAQFGQGLGDLQHVMVVDPRDDDGVRFDDDVVFLEDLDAFELAGQQQGGRGLAAQDDLAVAGPGVDLGPDFRVHGVDRDGDVGDAQFGQGLGVGRQGQAVGGQAEEQVRVLVL